MEPVRPIIDLLLPPSCPGCGREGDLLCARCRGTLERRLEEPAGTPIGLPAHLPDGIVQLEWCAAFTGVAQAAIHALKYDGERRLAGPLGLLLAERWRRSSAGGDVIVPVPMHAARRRERGFDQAEMLAAVVARRLGLPMSRAIERRDDTLAQHQLGRSARARNVGRAFVAGPARSAQLRDRWVVLIDDVLTTGATLAGCASAACAAGAVAVSALTLARER